MNGNFIPVEQRTPEERAEMGRKGGIASGEAKRAKKGPKEYFVETAHLPEYNSFYLSGGADPNHPLVSPIREENLENLPQALVITAEFDPMRDEGEIYAENLSKCGVHVVAKRNDGVTHGFLGKWTHLDEYKDVLTDEFLNS